MTAIALRPDAAVWSEVPAPDLVEQWLQPHVDAAPAERRARVVDAGLLAARTRIESDASIVLFLDIARGAVLSALAIYAWDDVPAADSADAAAAVARKAVPSAWEVDTHDVELGPWRGWRVTVLDGGTSGGGSAVTATTAWSVYVLDVAGRCVVGLLPPLPPEAALLAQHHSEHALATLEAGER